MSNFFLVYKHTCPNGKVYVGITSQNPPNLRWRNGNGYRNNHHFWGAICKYGWDSISHEILYSDLSVDEAQQLEVDLIAKFKSNNPQFGYNQTTGGDFNTTGFSADVLSRIGDKTRSRWENPDYRQNMINKLTGHICSEETKQKISRSKVGKKSNHPSPLKGRHISEEHRDKLRGHTPWCKGKTKETDDRIYKYSLKLRGKPKSQESIEKLSNTQRNRYANGFDTVWVHNSMKEHLVERSNLDEYISAGYELGRLNNLNVYVNKDGSTIKVSEADLNNYLNDGWELGKDKHTCDNVAKSHQKYVYVYQGNLFYSAKSLAEYLHTCGYPKIVSGTITEYFRTGKPAKSYIELFRNIERYENTEN